MIRWVQRFGRLVGRGIRALRSPRAAAIAGLAATALAAATAYAFVRIQRHESEAEIEANKPEDARRRLDRCLRIWPWNGDLHRLAGRAARMAGDLAAAESHLNRSLKLHGTATESLQLEFLLLRAQGGELDEVVPALSDTVDKGHADAPMILETVARAYIVQLRYRPAYVCLSKWIELRPETARAYQWRGWVTERLNNHSLAAEDYRKAIQCEPSLVLPRLRLAELLLDDKRAPEAIEHLEELVRLDPASPHVRSRLGICRFLQGDRAEARKLMEATVPDLPGDPTLLTNLARLELQEGHFAAAEKWLNAVFAADPSDNEARYLLISVFQVQGRTEDAARALAEYNGYKAKVDRVNGLLKDAVENPATGPDEFAEIGEFLLEIGRPEVARYWLEKGLQRDPGHRRSHGAMAAYYDKKNDAANAAIHRNKLRAP